MCILDRNRQHLPTPKDPRELEQAKKAVAEVEARIEALGINVTLVREARRERGKEYGSRSN